MEIVLEKSQVVDLRLDLHKQGISIGDDLNLVVNDQDQFILYFERCCQTNENSHRIACAALIYALNSWRHSVRAAVRLILKLSRE